MFWASQVVYRDHRKWSRGSTGRGHQPQEVAWAKRGRETSPKWAGAPPTRRPKAQEVERGGTLGAGGPKAHLGVRHPLPLPWPPHLPSGGAAAPPRVGTLGVAPPPLLLYIVGVSGLFYTQFSLSLGAALLFFLLLCAGAWRSPAGRPRLSIDTTPSCCWSSSPTSPSSLLDQGAGDVTGLHVC